MNISFIAMNRMVEQKIASDPGYAARIRADRRPVLSDLRNLTVEALLAKARLLMRLDLDKERLRPRSQ
ncbi:MAG: hypothetical protein HYX75_10485 [Acidobacteria bacterium]|nr:hypothetical protein [Acidobacteriota bacterium]